MEVESTNLMPQINILPIKLCLIHTYPLVELYKISVYLYNTKYNIYIYIKYQFPSILQVMDSLIRVKAKVTTHSDIKKLYQKNIAKSYIKRDFLVDQTYKVYIHCIYNNNRD